MSVIPSRESLSLELSTLSYVLYDCIRMAEVLGPTFKEYDRYRDREWCTSRPMLRAFGLQPNSAGWSELLGRYGFQHPTLSQVQKAAHKRKEESSGPRTHIALEDESFPELVASSVREVHVDGKTYYYWSIR